MINVSTLKTLFFSLLMIIVLAGCDNDDGQSQLGEPDLGEPTHIPQAETIVPEIIASDSETSVTDNSAALATAAPLDMDSNIDDPRSKQMLSYLNELAADGRFMGSVFVAQDGSVILNEGFGMADIEAGIPNSPQNKYRIGSLTKQFTASAILKLQEDGLLNVQDSVQKYLPNYPGGERITIHQLLIHTAGIPNYERRRDLPQVVQSPITLDDLIASFSGQPLDFPPGQRYSYSSSGYVVLTKIIEVVSGQSYDDYIQEKIFRPIGMGDSGYDFLDPAVQNSAIGYLLRGQGAQPAFPTDSSWPTGAGALYSTVRDLYRWDRALYGSEILTQDSKEAMFTPWVDTGQGADYGYGWDIGTTMGRPSAAHGGGIFGFASYMVRFPDDDAVIIVLSNGIQMPPRVVAEQLTQILFNSARS